MAVVAVPGGDARAGRDVETKTATDPSRLLALDQNRIAIGPTVICSRVLVCIRGCSSRRGSKVT
jgi:hypothetical protein